jgi:hypothetical protein
MIFSMRIRWFVVAALGLAALFAAKTARAQVYGPPPAPPGYYAQPEQAGIHRYGLVVGGGIGAAAFNFSDCSGCNSVGALALQLELGGMVSPHVAIVADWSTHLHPLEGGGVLSSNLFDGSVRYFFSRIFWLQGGIGIGWLQLTDEYGYDYLHGDNWGLGLLGAFGIEVLQTYNFALDLSVRLSGERIYGDNPVTVSNAAFLVGFHWY